MLVAGFRPVGLDRDSLNYAAVVGSGMGGAFFGSREPTFWIISLLSQRSPLPGYKPVVVSKGRDAIDRAISAVSRQYNGIPRHQLEPIICTVICALAAEG